MCDKSPLEADSATANHLKSDLDTSKTSQGTRELDQSNANHLISDLESLEASQSVHELEKESGLVLGSTVEERQVLLEYAARHDYCEDDSDIEDDFMYVCTVCLKPDDCDSPLKLCTGFRVTRDCSRECQVKHWPSHKVRLVMSKIV